MFGPFFLLFLGLSRISAHVPQPFRNKEIKGPTMRWFFCLSLSDQAIATAILNATLSSVFQGGKFADPYKKVRQSSLDRIRERYVVKSVEGCTPQWKPAPESSILMPYVTLLDNASI